MTIQSNNNYSAHSATGVGWASSSEASGTYADPVAPNNNATSLASSSSSSCSSSQAASSRSSSSLPWLFTKAVGAEWEIVAHLGLNEIRAMSEINKAWYQFFNGNESRVKERLYRNLLFNHSLPGIKEEQLPFNRTIYHLKTKEIAWKETYKSISQVVFGHEFLKSMGVRANPVGPIPPHLFEKRYLPTHTVEIPADSPLGLTRDGKLTNGPKNPNNPDDPGHYAPQDHRYDRPRLANGAEGFRTLEFPNTQFNRDFLAENPSLRVTPYPMQSPLEQGSPFISFQTNLEIDVPVESRLRSVNGVLTESFIPRPTEAGVNGKRTIRFLNTPHNWLILAEPVLTDPHRPAGPDNPCFTKYLAGNAKPVGIEYAWDDTQEKSQWNITPAPGWKAPVAKLVALGSNYEAQITEAETLDQHSMTFQQDSIHRILTQIRGTLDLYPGQFSKTSTDITAWGATYKAGTYMYPAAVAPAAPAGVSLSYCVDNDDIGLAAAWGPAGSLKVIGTCNQDMETELYDNTI